MSEWYVTVTGKVRPGMVKTGHWKKSATYKREREREGEKRHGSENACKGFDGVILVHCSVLLT
jgi:hypothetical protein